MSHYTSNKLRSFGESTKKCMLQSFENEALMNICEMPMKRKEINRTTLESLISKQKAWNDVCVCVCVYNEVEHEILFCK